MTFWRTFHRVNEDLAFLFGFSLNILLLIVIKTIRVKAMQKYHILLFQYCCVDMLQVVISFIVKPAIVFHERNEYYLSNGFLQPIGGWIEMLGIILWIVSVFFCINCMPISFIFRYRILCLNAEISKKFYVVSLIIAFLSASTYGMALWKFHYLDNHNSTYLAEKNLGWLLADSEGKVKAASVCFAGSLGMLLVIIDASVITFIPYGVITFYHLKILKYFKNHQHSLSVASRRVQMDLNRILTAQAIIPVFTAFLPMGIHVFSGLSSFDLVLVSFIFGFFYSWIPVGNAISVLFFVTAYRKKLKQLILHAKPRLSSVLSVSATTKHCEM